MPALRFAGTTSERDANPTRGVAGRESGRAKPEPVESSEEKRTRSPVRSSFFAVFVQRVESRPVKAGRLVFWGRPSRNRAGARQEKGGIHGAAH